MRRLLGFGLVVPFLLACPGDSTGPEEEEFDITCAASEPVCPPGSNQLGYSGDEGAPSITPSSSSTTVSTANSSHSASGTTNATSNGHWLIVIGTELRSSGVLDVSGGQFSAEIPLFCGTQQLVYTFDSGGNRAYFRTSVTQTGCTAAQLRVQLSWDTDDSDIDLHLIRPGGTFESDNDCYWANCQGGGLEWGASGDPGDPLLDVDDVFGFGPENIVIGSGAESGEYRIIVYNFDGTPSTRATVKLYLNEVEVRRWTSQTLDSGRDYWTVGRVNVLTGAVTTTDTYSGATPTLVIGGRKKK